MVLKRITTGNDEKHFATFEVSGPPEALLLAWKEAYAPKVAAECRKNMDGIRHVDNREHPDHGKPFLEFSSIWCEV